jgi:hypothetical protein
MAEQEQPELDDVKRKFREALERKHAGHGGDAAGKGKRSFRRKSG